MIFYYIWKEDPLPTNDKKEVIDNLQNTILKLTNHVNVLDFKADSLKVLNIELYHKNDSLTVLKAEVKTEYREVYITIKQSSNQQLDSLIRSNW